MDKTKVLFGVAGILGGFILGFLFANSQNRKEVENLQAEIARLKSTTGNQQSLQNQQNQTELSKEEIQNAIKRGDEKPDDLELQRKLGISLYKYAMTQRDASYLPDIARILKRSAKGSTKDYELFITLGNVLFDSGQNEKNPKMFIEAREWYQKALELKPDDPNVRTDLGLTYFFANPSQPEKAITEYRKSLKIDPKHEPTLQNLIQALIAVKQIDEARKLFEELKTINPSNPNLSELETQLLQAK